MVHRPPQRLAHVQLVEYYTDLLKFAQICSHPKKSVWWHMRGWRACPSLVAPSATPVAGLCANACLAGLGSYNHYLGTGLRSTYHFLLWWGCLSVPNSSDELIFVKRRALDGPFLDKNTGFRRAHRRAKFMF